MLSTTGAAAAEPVSSLSQRETLVLFDTAANLSADGRTWRIPVHGWVYVPQQSRARRTGIAAIFKKRYGLDADGSARPHFDERVNLLLADNRHGRRIVVAAAGQTFAMPPTARNGHFQTEIALDAEQAGRASQGERLTIRAVLPVGDGRSFWGAAHLVGARGLSVISDIDDTVKISHVTDRARLWRSTFYEPFAAVPGMADLYRRIAADGAHLHFVSSSPWHLYAPLTTFLAGAGFPPAALDLKAIRLKDRTVLDILKPASKTKPPQIEAILARWPHRRFVLIGDSGELDPEIYAEVARRHGDRIARILIRNVTGAHIDDARFIKAFAGVDRARWQLFDRPEEIEALR